MQKLSPDKTYKGAIIKDEKNFLDECEQKNINIVFQHESLFLLDSHESTLYLSACTLSDVYLYQIKSIKDASNHLKSVQKFWYHLSINQHRRGELIKEQLFPLKKKTYDFLDSIPKSNIGAFALLDNANMLVMPKSNHPLPLGEINFNENKTEPPSRAYLKLWELFTLYLKPPQKGEIVMDLGSSPGGWSWVLSQLGTTVHSIDKAPLAENLNDISNIRFIQDSAFALDPKEFKSATWVLSDIIAYPEALLGLINKWLNELPNANFVFTIKFQGKTDFETLNELLKIDDTKIFHLYNNKHEVTWVKAPPSFFK